MSSVDVSAMLGVISGVEVGREELVEAEVG